MTKQKLLVVDDDESVLEYLETALKVEDYEVVAAATATQALGILRSAKEEIPVVLADIMMPGINGIELLKMIRKDYPDCVVLMLTAHASMDSAMKALNEGAFAYLTKPVVLDELRSTLRNAFDKYTLVQENRKLVQALKEEKEYSETIVRNLIYTVIATDAEGHIKKINRAMENLLGYREEEIVGLSIQSLFSDEFKQTTLRDLVSKTHVQNFPVTFKAKDGHDIKVSFTGTIMKDAQGQVLGFLGTATA